MKSSCKFTAASVLALVFALPTTTARAVDLDGYGTLSGDLRLRFEEVQQDGKIPDAEATTFRARLGYLSPVWNGLSGFGEIETIRNIGDNNYNDGINNKTAYPNINDPHDTAVNQLYATYKNDRIGQARIGRQVITFDNQRWVGRSNFSQNDQTYDAVNLSTGAIVPGWEFAYVNSWKVNRRLGSRADAGRYSGDINLFHAQSSALPYDLTVSLYTYLYNIERSSTLSTRTHGGRVLWNPKDIVQGSSWQPLAAGELAVQSDYTNNPLNYTQFYQSYELGAHSGKLKISGEFNSLGGNGVAAVQTPTASNHCQNGCTDKFTTTPARGLQDYKLQTVIPLPFVPSGQSLTAEGAVHYFGSTVHDQHYGNEVDGTLSYSPFEGHVISASVGRYAADQLMTDTVKYWLSYEVKF